MPNRRQAIHYGRSLLRRSPRSLRSAVVVCTIHSQGGTFYRLSHERNILCTELADLAEVAHALTRLLMTPPQYLGLNMEVIHNNELWSIFEPLVPVWHGGCSLVFRESRSIFNLYIPEESDDDRNDKWIAKVSLNSCAEECVHFVELYGAENYRFISLNDGEVMLSNMIGSRPTEVDWGTKEFLNSCWLLVSQLHAQNMVHRDIRLPNFIIDGAGRGKVIDLQSVVAAGELCAYHGSIETASPYVWSRLTDQAAGIEKKVRVMPIDDAMSFILCVIMARFSLYHELTVAIRNGLDLQILWSSIFQQLVFTHTDITAIDIGLISIANMCQSMCMGELRLLEYAEHIQHTNKIVKAFIDLIGR
eukprot:CAMPEP_0185031474 /NCGR_PEP_ID=MMETSP1103-20130426/18976_1 /TAXON_ID=36769 /ORGANISM="Paraphysomonas bandaiensis, Strain Caron Lab Isolate" /LENGTH=360 /DNA_ID=CAMNT_0027567017 /DNA_START=403 /DNA_END=1485 /DNA_ORIENTATION=+